MDVTAASTRVLIYSHDSFGLGHLRRCRAIANALAQRNVSVSNIETSKPFYEAVLGFLNYDLVHGSDTYAMGACIAPSLSLVSPLREV